MSEAKTRSLWALDALNFCNAGIQTGLGPFMSIYYTAVRHWNPGQIGILIACQSLSGIAVQGFVGNWIDESHHKRLATAIASGIVALGALGIAVVPQFYLQIIIQLVIGLAVTIFPATTAAFALGLVEQNKLSRRVARNESLTHTGNAAFAIAAGAVGTLLALEGIFFAAAIFAAGMIPAALSIQASDVSYEAARGGGEAGESEPPRRGIRELFVDKRVLTFAVAVVLFYFANAATLPLVGEILTQGKHGRQSAWQVAAAVIVAEAVMIGVAVFGGRLADAWGRKPLFLLGFAMLAIRNGLTVVNHNEYYLISLQAFDGIAMGLYGVLLTLVTADLARGTGRFNLLQGAVQSAMGLGGVLSNAFFGWVAKAMGFNASFWGLAIVAAAGGALYQLRMPETKPQQQGEDETAVAKQRAASV
ncbi:MAG: MFS transporter [Acidobacteriaceae bacterium]|nr:MFS transporter [Acidobacteriaceae bacterium]MBV8569251.1 MFS transporter [Acidobacteriaceae bacterium]